MGQQALLAFQPHSCLQVSVIPKAGRGERGKGQTMKLITALKVDVSRCCLYGVCFLLQCL